MKAIPKPLGNVYMRSKCFVVFGLVVAFVMLLAAASAPAALVFNMNAAWRYLKGTNEASTPVSAWRAQGFNDSSWGVGNMAFYYGETLSGTLLADMQGNYSSVFFRKTFNIANASEVTAMELRSILDDGFIAWINGVEVARFNMPAGDVAFNGAASGALDPELTLRTHALPPPSGYLVNGQNTIAVHGFNASLAGSSDFVLNLQLLAATPDSQGPTVASANPPAGSVTTLDQITVTFNEPTTGVNASDFLVNGQPALSAIMVDDSTYTFTFPQPPYGTVQISWASSHDIQDYGLPPNAFDHTGPGATWQYTLVDTTPPVINRIIPTTNSLVRELRQIEVQFSEAITGADAADLRINGAAATDMTAGGPGQLLFQFPQPATGMVSVAFASGHGIADTAGNPFAGASWAYVLDTNLPPESFIISEVQARNNSTLRDEDGQYEDWIEIHNTAPVPGNLNGWFLTDSSANLTKWRIPNVSIAAGGYLVIFASNKNRPPNPSPAGQLHTNFQLSENGEFLALVDPRTNIVSSFAPSYPAFPPGEVSYGRDRTDPNLKGFFTIPTPGQPNQSGGPGDFAPDIVFSRESGTFVSSFPLSLSLATPNPSAQIRYVIVNNATAAALTNVPTATSTLYTGPITINGTMQVRARAFESGKLPGTPVTASYIQIASNAVNFSSDLPLVIVHNFGAGSFPGIGDQTAIVAFFDVDEATGRSSLTNKPQLITRSGVNRRGSSTQDYTKPSLAVELWDEFNQDTDHEVLGLPDESDWVLYAPNQFDHSLLHNPIGLQLARDVGDYASRTRMVETFMDINGGPINLPNFSSAGDYTGVHVLEEKVKRNGNRVDIARLEAENRTQPSISGGWLLKIDRVDADERTFSAAASTIVYQEPDGRDVQLPQWDPQEAYIANYFNDFWNTANGPNWTNPIIGYAAYIDVDSWIDAHLNSVITMNVDAFRLSGYFFKDRNKKIEMGPVWDFDRAMGTSAKGGDWRAYNPRGWRATNPLGASDYGTDFFNATTPPPWWERLFRDPDFFQRWIDRYQDLRTGAFDTNRVLAMIDRMADEVREAQTRELIRWSAPGNSDTSPRTGRIDSPVNIYGLVYTYTFPGTYQGEIDFQKSWYHDHIHFMDTNFLQRPNLGHPGGMLTSPIEFVMAVPPTNRAGTTIYYTLDGTDPRQAGGGISPTALTYTGPITISGNARVFARCHNINHRNLTGTGHPPISSPWSGASTATFYFDVPPLRITEIMYHPADPPSGNTNDADNFEYIEVKNISTTTSLNLNRFRIRGGIEFDFGNLTLPAGGKAVIVSHQAAFVQRYGSGITIAGVYTNNIDKAHLDNGGERLILEGPLREPIHDFEYSDDWYPSTDGLGFSLVIRDENAPLDTWGLASSWRPSGALNGSPGQDDPPGSVFPPIVINEVLTHSDPPPPFDTIELRNLSGSDVPLGGWFLTDEFDRPTKYRIPDVMVIPANGFLTFNEGHFSSGANAFSLSSLGEEVYLFSGDGTNITGYVHGFDFGAAPNGVTFGRYVNSVGSEQFPAQVSATLGAANSSPRVGPVVVSEIMYHPIDWLRHDLPQDNGLDEYIELHNSLVDEAVPLYDPVHPTNTWRLRDAVDFDFPQGVSIPAGGQILVVSFDPNDATKLQGFRQRNGVSASVPIYGPFRGKLDNSGESVELERPDVPEPPGPPNFGLVPYVLVERIRYTDQAPWPAAADGIGPSLQRVSAAAYGNDPASWVAAFPTPGQPFGGGSAPVITQHPTNKTTIATHTVSLDVVASGASAYQWRFNGDLLRGETNASLVFESVRPDQQGFYDVLVINGAGSVLSSNAFLTVLIPANILGQPADQIFRNGSTNEAMYGQTTNTAIFQVNASSTTPISYQWRFNSNIISGATSHTLAIPNVNLTHNGYYDCLVTDAVGTIRSRVALLSVTVPPFYQRHPQPIVALQGETITFGVEHLGSDPFGYRWRRNSVALYPTNGGYTYFPSLTLANVQIANGGTYTVVTTNFALPGGVLSLGGLLTVHADFDHDGAGDPWEIQNGFMTNALSMDGFDDTDGDGATNAEEYRAGTNPRDAISVLKVTQFDVGSPTTITFNAISNKTYMVEYTEVLDPALWIQLGEVTARTTNRVITISDPAPTAGNRYYRLVTPMRQD
jgi:hypothetical protein